MAHARQARSDPLAAGRLPAYAVLDDGRAVLGLTPLGLAILLLGGAFTALMIGNFLVDPRLIVLGVALNPWLYLLLIVIAIAAPVGRPELKWLFLFLLPTLGLLLSLFWSSDATVGLFKYVNLAVSYLLGSICILGAIRIIGVQRSLQIIVFMLLALLVATVLYKMRYGFFDRQTQFFMNGAIVFARLMGMAAIASLLAFRRYSAIVLFSIFFLAVVWAASKGPLLALTIAAVIVVWNQANRNGRIALAIGALPVVAAVLYLAIEFQLVSESNRLWALVDLFTWNRSVIDSDTESVGVRVRMYRETLDIILHHPFGVGLGGWAHSVVNNFGQTYPHNLFLEVLSEAGWFLGVIALLPFVAFLFFSASSIGYIALYLLLAQQVSGDILDGRFLLVFAVLSVLLSLKPQNDTSIADTGPISAPKK